MSAPFPEFDVEGVWLDNAYFHPSSRGARQAVADYLAFRSGVSQIPPAGTAEMQVRVRRNFARLIGADTEEIAFVPSATVGENLIAAALDLKEGSRVVTDALHYAGSLRIYEGLKTRGVDVEVLNPWSQRIALEDVEEALTRRTDLVAVSAVSQRNGFQHDLPALCSLAHSRGALVYADIMQIAGARPFDVRASGVDFCATSTYKWLMADQGIGLLYVRADRLAGLGHPQFGSRQTPDYPIPGTATGRRFEVGTVSLMTVAALDYSLSALLAVTPEAIRDRTTPFLERLRRELPPCGLIPMTPEDSHGPILTFQTSEAPALAAALNRAGVFISVYTDFVRIAPSFYNTDADIDRLVEAAARL